MIKSYSIEDIDQIEAKAELPLTRCLLCKLSIPRLRIIFREKRAMIENECDCSMGKVHYYHLEEYLEGIHLKYEESIDIVKESIEDINIMSLSDFIVYARKYLDNNSHIHHNIQQQANKLDLFYYKHNITYLQSAYDFNRKINESVIHLFFCLYSTLDRHSTHISYDNIKYAARSLSSMTSFNDIIDISNDNVHDNIARSLAYFNKEFIIKAASLPLEFTLKKKMKAHTAPAYSLSELSNGYLLSGADDHKLKIWDMQTYQNVTTLIGHTASVFGIQEMIDGKLASCSEDRTIVIWDRFPYKYLLTLKGHTDNVNSIIQIKDKRLVTGSDDCTIKLWSIEPLNTFHLSTLTPNSGPVSLVSELIDGRVLGLHINGKISIWNSVSLTNEALLGSDIETGLWFCIQLNSSDLIAFLDNHTIDMWNVYSYKRIKTIPCSQTEVFSIFCMEDGIIGSASPNSIAVFSPYEGKCLKSYDGLLKEATFLIRLTDGRVVYSSKDNSIYVLS